MFLATRSKKRLALLVLIFLAVFSTGMVIVHQCQSMPSSQIALQHQHLAADSIPPLATKASIGTFDRERLIDSGCMALFIVVLLCGRKLSKLRGLNSPLNTLMDLGREFVSVCRPQVSHFTLSRLQLGVIRI